MAKFVQQLGFDFVFGAARRRRAHRAFVRASRDLRGAAHDIQFVRILDQPHVVEHGAHVGNRGGRGHTIAHLGTHRVKPTQHPRIPRLVAAEVTTQLRLIGQQIRHARIELAYRMAFVEAEYLARLLRTVPKSIPDFALDILVAAKQHTLRLVSRDYHQHGLGLDKTGQIIKIAVVAVGIMRIAVARAFWRRRDDGNTALDARGKTRAPFGVNRRHARNNGEIGHAGIIRRAAPRPTA